MGNRILLSSPHMSDEGFELEYIHDTFAKNWIAPLGENVNEFEKAIAAYMGIGFPVALSAGTAAVVVAHLYGSPAKMDQIVDICDKHQGPLIEDAGTVEYFQG